MQLLMASIRESVVSCPNHRYITDCLIKFKSVNYGYDSGFDKFYSIRDTNSQAPLFKRLSVKVINLLNGSVTYQLLKPIHDRWMAKQGGEDRFKPPHSDADTVDELLEWPNMRSEPYFLWVHFMNAHTPYSYWPEHLEAIF